MSRYLTPIMLKERYYAAIEARVQEIFDELIYRPLFAILHARMQEIENATGNALLDAIRLGRVWYDDGQFRGQFSALISRQLRAIGAVYNGRTRTWLLENVNVPSDVRFAQATADARYGRIYKRVIDTLNGVQLESTLGVEKIKADYEKTLDAMEADFQKTIPSDREDKNKPESALSKITIEAKFTPESKARVASEWATNLDLYIRGWMQENILKLREQIQPHVLAGGRAQGLVKAIQENYGVSQRKAKFLARQETALLMSKYQETRYADMGITHYRWSDAHDKRVRHDHHELNGKVFSFLQPPVTNRKTGARNNPGQDFNCRCVCIPIIQ